VSLPDDAPSTETRVRKRGAEEVSKPYVLIVISGGVADIAQNTSSIDVDILDYDNLESTAPDDLILSDNEWEYLKANNPDLFEFFAPSYAKKDE